YTLLIVCVFFFFFSSRRRHTRFSRDWSSDVCSSDLDLQVGRVERHGQVQLATGGGDVGGETLVILHVTGGQPLDLLALELVEQRSEERRVGKECRSRWSPCH